MPFTYHRTVRFQDTDAAGVVYFATILAICHEAYEASLVEVGIDLRGFFSGTETVIPIAHTSADFFRPLFCGDRLSVLLTPNSLKDSEFEINYEIFLINQLNKPTNRAKTRHVCINSTTRTRENVPSEIARWLQQFQIKH
ncbi:acyl-CoA thioesterase [Kovacikia minuta CCNUW1]|uniref:acyl-CoA thioesterase n=1 Tax=Kovacikia minuta TaxID=2931930 RepID=UPI001CCAFC92|nr:thioesterase family protein [Kovacikia minuta]UBF24888.1 acyl-CoA thioesterase [Kovacikia minuta CCNUW1]